METKRDPAELRKDIDDALAEIERVEDEVMQLFIEVLGPQAAAKVIDYKLAREREPNLETLKRAATPGSSTEPPRTR